MDTMDPSYVMARKVLLDALGALSAHGPHLVLVGAQAVYLRTGPSALNVPLMTTDADLAVDTAELLDAPEIGSLLGAIGFTPGTNPGHWVNQEGVAVDLMVVPHQSGRTGKEARAAHLVGHGKRAARVARGLEPALIDNDRIEIRSLDASDGRSISARVAGPAALLVAKAHKIRDRMGQADRQSGRIRSKDALDMLRILQAVETADLVGGFARHRIDAYAWGATTEALAHLSAEAAEDTSALPTQAAQAGGDDPGIAPSFAILVQELLSSLAEADLWGAP